MPPTTDLPGIANKLMVPGSRWGWSYRDNSVLLEGFSEPHPELLAPTDEQVRHAQSAADRGHPAATTSLVLLGVGLIGTGVAVWQLSIVLALVAIVAGCAAVMVMRVRYSKHALRRDVASHQTQWEQRKQAVHEEHQVEVQRWKDRLIQFDRQQWERINALPQWGAIRTADTVPRIDVFGGSVPGWESLITTFGSSVLASGAKLAIFDFSEGAVAAELCHLANAAGIQARVLLLPQELDRVPVPPSMGPDDLTESLLESLDSDVQRDRGSRSVDDMILGGVARCLAPDFSVARLVAGLEALLAGGPLKDGSVLNAGEQTAIRELFDFDFLTQVRERVVRLRAQLNEIRELGTVPADDAQFMCYAVSETGKAVVNEILMDLLPQIVIRSLATGSSDHPDVLVIAGSDRMRRQHLERLSELCLRRGLRLVLMFKHLREEVTEVLGGGEAAAIFMRLGNPDEAERAARFIGESYRFEVAELSEVVGRNTTETYGRSEEFGETSTIGLPMLYSRGTSRQWGFTESVAQGTSREQGMVKARVKEYEVEPTVLQQLSRNMFLLVQLDQRRGGRLIAAGDCNPDLALMDRVSMEPLPGLKPAATGP